MTTLSATCATRSATPGPAALHAHAHTRTRHRFRGLVRVHHDERRAHVHGPASIASTIRRLPRHTRTWDPETGVWDVQPGHLGQLLLLLTRAGYRTRQIRPGQPAPRVNLPRLGAIHGPTWPHDTPPRPAPDTNPCHGHGPDGEPCGCRNAAQCAPYHPTKEDQP